MYVYYMHAWCLQRPEKDIRSLGFRVTDNCVPPNTSWQPSTVAFTRKCGPGNFSLFLQLFFAKKKQDLKLQTFACL